MKLVTDRVDEELRSGSLYEWNGGAGQEMGNPPAGRRRAGRREGQRRNEWNADRLLERGVQVNNRTMFAGARPEILSSS